MNASVHQSSRLLHSFKSGAYMPPDFNQVLYGMNGRSYGGLGRWRKSFLNITAELHHSYSASNIGAGE